jgi:hypothetical protein
MLRPDLITQLIMVLKTTFHAVSTEVLIQVLQGAFLWYLRETFLLAIQEAMDMYHLATGMGKA